MNKLLSLAASIALISPMTVHAASAIVDDFNDGNDTEWTRVSPLTGFGAGGVYTFPSGGYNISAPVSPNPLALGPARAGAIRTDQSFSNFDTWVDVLDWNGVEPEMVLGVVARVNSPGLGTTSGYGFTYNAIGRLSLVRITSEVDTTLINSNITLTAGNDYRFHFTGSGSDLAGEVYNLSGGAALASLSASDATYASGSTGVFVYDNSATGNHTSSATFDNFSASVPEPGATALSLAALGLMVRRRR